jgi:hypothetical protein
VSAAVHAAGDFPLLVLPGRLLDRSKKQTCTAPAKYVVQLIATCERAIGPAVEEHLSLARIMHDDVGAETLRENYMRFVRESAAMPEHIKSMALEAAAEVDHLRVYRMFIEAVRNALRPQPVPVPA